MTNYQNYRNKPYLHSNSYTHIRLLKDCNVCNYFYNRLIANKLFVTNIDLALCNCL